MDIKDFAFRNSSEWIEYSHNRYLPLEDIRRRLATTGEEWKSLEHQFAQTRKVQSIPLVLRTIDKVFWYFEADCIRQKLSQVERLGTHIYDKIVSQKTFEQEFNLNASIEEAITSAIYEGANTTRSKARQFIAENRPPRDKAEQMLINNYQAMQWIKENHQQQVTKDVILKVHAIVTKKTLEGNDVNYSGKFRDDVVYIGNHEGVNHKLIERSLDEAIAETTQNRRFLHPLIKGVLLHYLIAYIHPFFDGNGRTARTMFYFKSIRNHLNFVELLSISAHLKEHGRRYERAFENAVIHDGDLTYFVDFALDSLLAALKVVEQKVTYLQSVWRLKERFKLSDPQVMLLQRLALNKFRRVTIDEHAKNTERSHEMARLELKELVKHGLLIEQHKAKKFTYVIDSKHLKKLVFET